jgi:gamma-glutamyltranspeptidase/glutathione hydrolase
MPDRTHYAPRGLVCSVDHLASAAGLSLLRSGGSAVDAAVAASAVLAVTTQQMCGMGGDLVAVLHPGRGAGEPAALVAVGAAGSGADAAALRAAGHRRMPYRGDIRTVTMPGCVDGWLALHARIGRRPLAEVLAPAIGYASEGFPVSPLLAAALPAVADVAGAAELIGDQLPAAGELRRRPRLARSLTAIAAAGRDGWYGGEFGTGLLRVGHGLFDRADLERDSARWSAPLAVRALGWVLPAPPAPTAGYLPLAVAAPRWALVDPEATGFDTWDTKPGGLSPQVVRIEDGAPDAWYDGLSARGHRVERAAAGGGFGNAQVAVLADGVVGGDADQRAGTGAAVGW